MSAMIKTVETIRKVRSLQLERIKFLSAAQLNAIPEGFSNNIAWNLGHLLAVQQAVCYKKAGLPALIYDHLWERFGSGSKPEGIINADEIEHIIKLLLTTLDQLEADYHKRVFNNYPAWFTRYDIELSSIDDALQFLMFHEGIHAGAIIAMYKILTK